jgi:hypothetical protein
MGGTGHKEAAGETERDLTVEERVHFSRLLERGMPPDEVTARLVDDGWPKAAAERAVARLDDEVQDHIQRNPVAARGPGQGSPRTVVGALLLLVGIGITAVTYLSAEERGGGAFVVAWGAILAGILMLVRGSPR